MLREVCGRLGEEFMVLLPETLPFLAELMEGELTHTHTVIIIRQLHGCKITSLLLGDIYM